jgi:hypothetical protein
VGLIRSYFALFENFDGALGKFQKNEQGFAINDINLCRRKSSESLSETSEPPARKSYQPCCNDTSSDTTLQLLSARTLLINRTLYQLRA